MIRDGLTGYNFFMDLAQSALYPVLIAAGAALGLFWSWLRIADDPRRFEGHSIHLRRDGLIPAAFTLLAGGLFGSRIAFVFLHLSYYQFHVSEIGRFWEGGLDWTGAPLGAAVLFLIYVGWKGLSPLEILEDLSPFWTVLVAALWLGCGTEGLYVGPPLKSTYGVDAIVNGTELSSARLPLAGIGAVVTVLAGSFVDWYSVRRKIKMFHFGWVFIFQMGLLFSFSFIRKDPVAPLAGIASDRLAAAVYFLAALVILLILWLTRNPRNNTLTNVIANERSK